MNARIAPELTELPPTLTVKRAGELLGLSRSAAYRAAATGELPTLAFGRRLVVPPSACWRCSASPSRDSADAREHPEARSYLHLVPVRARPRNRQAEAA
jgi:excisionase family DNA binding protein